MSTLYLIFAHLVADFILQPQELVRWKYKSWKGTAMHAVIHLLLYLVIFFPYLPDGKVFAVLFGIALTHFAIDLVKIKEEATSPRYLFFFLVDQASHLGVILLSGMALADRHPMFAARGTFSNYYENIFIVLGLSLMILLSYTVEIIKYQLARQKKHGVKFKPDYPAMFKRILVFALLYAAFMIFGVYRTAAWGV